MNLAAILPTLKIVSYAAIALIVIGSLYYITNLRADLAVSEMNVEILQDSLKKQQETIETILAEQKQIRILTEEVRVEVSKSETEIVSLRDRFEKSSSGSKRDVGVIARSRPKLVENAINNATVSASRCMEIASGAPLTEKERNATKPSEINRECPSLANPSYKP